jgi:hypothetical protein
MMIILIAGIMGNGQLILKMIARMKMTEKFYTTEPYREANQKAQYDIENWPDVEQLRKSERHSATLILCAGLTFAIVLIWGVVYHARTNTPSQTVVHQSSGL